MKQLARIQMCNGDGTAQMYLISGKGCDGRCQSCTAGQPKLLTARNRIGAKPGELVTVRRNRFAAQALRYGLMLCALLLGFLPGMENPFMALGVLLCALAVPALCGYGCKGKQKYTYTITGYPKRLPRSWI